MDARVRINQIKKGERKKVSITSQVEIYPLPDIKNPLLVLVLDVSGSMNSDTLNYQKHAVDYLTQLYKDMSEGVVNPSCPPRISLVFYSTTVNKVYFQGNPWVNINNKSLSNIIDSFLMKTDHKDPRIGYNTDHIAAAQQVADIIARYRNEYKNSVGTCVIFMTDGNYDPNPITDANLSESLRRDNWHLLEKEVIDRCNKMSKDKMREVFDKYEEVLLAKEVVSRGDQNRFPFREFYHNNLQKLEGSLPRWDDFREKISGFHGNSENCCISSKLHLKTNDIYRFVRLGDDFSGRICDEDSAGLVEIETPNKLGYVFGKALAEWLKVEKLEVDKEQHFTVAPGIRALAISSVCVEDFTILKPDRKEKLEVKKGFSLEKNPNPGQYTIRDINVSIYDISIYANSRYQWSFGRIPQSYSFLDDPEIIFALFDRETKKRVDLNSLFISFPEEITCNCYGASSEQAIPKKMKWNSSASIYAYVGKIPSADSLKPGKLILEVELERNREFRYKNDVYASIKRVRDSSFVRGFIDIKSSIGKGEEINLDVLKGINEGLISEGDDE